MFIVQAIGAGIALLYVALERLSTFAHRLAKRGQAAGQEEDTLKEHTMRREALYAVDGKSQPPRSLNPAFAAAAANWVLMPLLAQLKWDHRN